MIPLPPQALALGGAACLLIGIGAGWTVRDWKADADTADGFKALLKAKDAGQAKVDAEAARFEAFRQSLDPVRVENRNTIREVYRNVPVPADCALRPDALRVLEQSRVRANASAAGEPGERMPDYPADPPDRPGAGDLGG